MPDWLKQEDNTYTIEISLMQAAQSKEMPNGKPFPFKTAEVTKQNGDIAMWTHTENNATYIVYNT